MKELLVVTTHTKYFHALPLCCVSAVWWSWWSIYLFKKSGYWKLKQDFCKNGCKENSSKVLFHICWTVNRYQLVKLVCLINSLCYLSQFVSAAHSGTTKTVNAAKCISILIWMIWERKKKIYVLYIYYISMHAYYSKLIIYHFPLQSLPLHVS